MTTNAGTLLAVISYGEVVITCDFESHVPGSNPGRRILLFCPYVLLCLFQPQQRTHSSLALLHSSSVETTVHDGYHRTTTTPNSMFVHSVL